MVENHIIHIKFNSQKLLVGSVVVSVFLFHCIHTGQKKKKTKFTKVFLPSKQIPPLNRTWVLYHHHLSLPVLESLRQTTLFLPVKLRE